MGIAAVIVAAGRGIRAGGELPKQFRALGGQAIISRVLARFLSHPQIDRVVVVIHPDDRSLLEETARGHLGNPKLLVVPGGGRTRQISVRNGLEALREQAPDLVLVHDAARPFVSSEQIDLAIREGLRSGAAIPGISVVDTVKLVDEEGTVVATPDRSRLRAVQTPQAFRFDELLAVHRRALQEGREDFSDDGALAEWAGLAVSVFEGDPSNVKLTRMEDFEQAEQRLNSDRTRLAVRLGTGFDVHAFAPGDHIWLGGVKIPHDQGVAAHSDGDVVLHALTDALLGALAEGDIGVHFPPSDPQWRGASSDRFLAFAAERVRTRGGLIDHLDATILCETPRLGPYREAMRTRIAEIVGIGIGSVSLKATTTERLGFTGRREGLAAQAAATIRLPEVGT
ncbi:bifunctional 2-C-methyl-D-erythritol 4-phosphate cytidylyltransferase/2-C-methyl-D-erythritol 2,4-cyclodiphosphate synthase [Microvirga massiliensis]|uniref:bifunctional 2-C-methyl-D-erythritol 4-phosphate cytidylyltransferase/2-C-methyl-D-erythritol 2,4-cyclodiphosphate synthase n=1 Tax=Microvirga massiliensis TaxID=1033741 RepID=UPI00062BED8A|nr:bifunctional 2-C-methyl-D-erythritol 4-phosphate cytidylyltransferase/2-C-methyl-D-erythritol 2,4-cyclodiphosphate synthase [Microvirga massiliensis]